MRESVSLNMTTTTVEAPPRRDRGLMARLTDVSVRYVERFMPDPFLFALVLTILVVVLVGVLVDGATAGGIVEAWYNGVWGANNIFTFALQMVLILVTGYTLAEAPVFKRGIVWLAKKPRNQVEGALLCFLVGAVLCLLNWGLGLVAGALVARQVARRMPGHHFGYLIAAGYMGYMVWTQGLSSSIALANTDTQSPINQVTGDVVPLSDTIFQPYSWVPVFAVIALLGLALWKMAPSTPLEADPAVYEDLGSMPEDRGPRTFATRLEP